MTISSWLNFGRPAPPGRGSAAGRRFLAPPYYSQRAVFASLWALFFIDPDMPIRYSIIIYYFYGSLMAIKDRLLLSVLITKRLLVETF